MVRPEVATGRPSRRDGRLLRAAIVCVAVAALPAAARSAASPLRGGGAGAAPIAFGRSAVGPIADAPVYDPPAIQFFALPSYGAMRVIASGIYGDFLPPTAVSFASAWSRTGPMSQTMGLDSTVSATLAQVLQEGLLPGGGAAGAVQIGAAPSDFAIASGGVVAAAGGDGSAASQAGALPSPSAAGGVQPVCGDNQLSRRLQAGGEFWNAREAGAEAVALPRGVFAGKQVGNPLGDLGPEGNPSNIARPGPAGDWCRPGPTPFYLSSPLESRPLWLALGIVIGGALVFWLSRGARLPA